LQKPKKLMGLYTKGLAKEKGNVIDIFIIDENWKPSCYYYKCLTQDVFLHTYSSTVEILEN